MSYTLAIGSLLDELSQDRGIDIDTRNQIQVIADIYKTAYQDIIITILAPLLWRLRFRIWAVANPESDASLLSGVKFFTSAEFMSKVRAAIIDICGKARLESMEAQRRGLMLQPSGLSLFLIQEDELSEEIYPKIDMLLRAISAKASKFDPGRERSFVRLCQKLSDILRLLSQSSVCEGAQ